MYGRGHAHLGLGERALGEADLAAARKEQVTIDVDVGRDGLPLAPVPAPPLVPVPASARAVKLSSPKTLTFCESAELMCRMNWPSLKPLCV